MSNLEIVLAQTFDHEFGHYSYDYARKVEIGCELKINVIVITWNAAHFELVLSNVGCFYIQF